MTTGAAPRRSNRRLTARRACLLTVRYKTATTWHPATAVNISAQGCRLRLGEDLERGTTVAVMFETPLRDGATALNAELEGVVSWSRLEGLSHQVGIQFTSPSQALQDLMDSLA
ncbi:MAG TPA: PilZ domain-containing protein [Vicinamibacteria bacterium]|nr:PilZ domain-containing protein [Vicinamibacteria bacterium]